MQSDEYTNAVFMDIVTAMADAKDRSAAVIAIRKIPRVRECDQLARAGVFGAPEQGHREKSRGLIERFGDSSSTRDPKEYGNLALSAYGHMALAYSLSRSTSGLPGLETRNINTGTIVAELRSEELGKRIDAVMYARHMVKSGGSPDSIPLLRGGFSWVELSTLTGASGKEVVPVEDAVRRIEKVINESTIAAGEEEAKE